MNSCSDVAVAVVVLSGEDRWSCWLDAYLLRMSRANEYNLLIAKARMAEEKNRQERTGFCLFLLPLLQ